MRRAAGDSRHLVVFGRPPFAGDIQRVGEAFGPLDAGGRPSGIAPSQHLHFQTKTARVRELYEPIAQVEMGRLDGTFVVVRQRIANLREGAARSDYDEHSGRIAPDAPKPLPETLAGSGNAHVQADIHVRQVYPQLQSGRGYHPSQRSVAQRFFDFAAVFVFQTAAIRFDLVLA